MANYTVAEDGTLVFFHVEVPGAWPELGIATALARGTFELLRKSGRKAILKCSFLVHFINAHPEYADIVEASIGGA